MLNKHAAYGINLKYKLVSSSLSTSPKFLSAKMYKQYLSVLNSQLHCHPETLPVPSGFLGNIFSHLLGGKSKGTDLGCKG